MASNAILAKLAVVISANTAEFGKAMNANSAALNKFQKTAQNVGNSLAGFVSVAAIASIGKQIIDVTAEFQKFEAVLSNTLGSNSAAQKALADIRVFAKETPFEVSEVTAAYVRWANQGLSPTIDRMTKLGDVASSLGAGFEQTAEAFKDLAVGQTKRIEEIGISATQANGKIQLSFKGVNLEIEKNAEGVQKALDTFSQLNGVLGTSEAVSKTLGGRISNLKDSVQELFLTVGEGSSGGLFDFITLLQGVVDVSGKVVKGINNQTSALGKYVAEFLKLPKLGLSILMAAFAEDAEEANKKLAEQEKKLKAINATADAAFNSGNIEAYIKALDQNIYKEEIIAEIRRRQSEESKKTDEATVANIKTYQDLEATLSDLNKQFKEKTDVNDKKELANIGNKIIAINAQIAALDALKQKQEELQPLSGFGKQQLANAQAGVPTNVVDPTSTSGITGAVTPFQIFDDEVTTEQRGQAMLDMLADVNAAYQLSSDQRESLADIEKGLHEDHQKREQQKADMARYVGGVIGDAIGDAINGQKSLIQVLKQTVAKLLPLFLDMALGGTIAGAASTAAPPPVILALAAAGVAAISAMFSKATGHSGGGVGGNSLGQRSSTNVQRLSTVQAFGETVNFQAQFRIQGQDLVAVANSQQNRNNRLGG